MESSNLDRHVFATGGVLSDMLNVIFTAEESISFRRVFTYECFCPSEEFFFNFSGVISYVVSSGNLGIIRLQ